MSKFFSVIFRNVNCRIQMNFEAFEEVDWNWSFHGQLKNQPKNQLKNQLKNQPKDQTVYW